MRLLAFFLLFTASAWAHYHGGYVTIDVIPDAGPGNQVNDRVYEGSFWTAVDSRFAVEIFITGPHIGIDVSEITFFISGVTPQQNIRVRDVSGILQNSNSKDVRGQVKFTLSGPKVVIPRSGFLCRIEFATTAENVREIQLFIAEISMTHAGVTKTEGEIAVAMFNHESLRTQAYLDTDMAQGDQGLKMKSFSPGDEVGVQVFMTGLARANGIALTFNYPDDQLTYTDFDAGTALA